MRIEQLIYLIVLSQSESINVASEKLFISHQSLNKSLTSLENELGATLFNRTPKGISLTPSGQKAVEIAQEILTQLERLKTFINGQNASLKGSLRIIASPLATNTIMAPIIKILKKRHPDIGFFIKEVSPPEVLTAFDTGQYDFGITNLHDIAWAKQIYPQLTFESLHQEDTIALVAKFSPLSQRRTLSIKTLLKHPLLFYGSTAEDGNYVARLLEPFGAMANCSYTNNQQIYYDGLTSGSYCAISTRSIYRSFDMALQSQLAVIPIKGALLAHVVLVYPNDQPISATATAAIDLVRHHYNSPLMHGSDVHTP